MSNRNPKPGFQVGGLTSGWGGITEPENARDWPASGTVLSWAEPRLRPRLVNCSPNLGRAGLAPGVELRVSPSAPARGFGTGRVPRSGARLPQAGCGSLSPQSCALREPVVSTPSLIRAALRGECAWHCPWVCVSPRGRRGARPSPLPSPPLPPRCARTLPADAHLPGPGRREPESAI